MGLNDGVLITRRRPSISGEHR